MLVGYIWQSFNFENYGVDAIDVEWLPNTASSINFYEDNVNRTAEFTIKKEDLLKWCVAIGRPLRVLRDSDEPVIIHRPTRSLERVGLLPIVPDPTAGPRIDLEEVKKWNTRYRKELGVEDFAYSETWQNGGGYYIGFDVEEDRAYYHFAKW